MVRKSPHPRRPYGGLVDKIRRRPWTVWPLVINKNHWILIVIKLQTQGPRQESIHNKWVEMPAEYHQNVEQVAIVDPMHSHQGPVVTAVWNRLVRFLIAGGLTFSRPEFGHPLRHVWVPPQRDGTSCGPRQYTVVRQFFQRLLVIYEADPTSVPYHDSLWQPMSGYFDDVHIRLEMAGFNAAQAVVDSDYHNRVAVELISKYTDGRNAKEGFNLPTGQPQLVKVPAEERRQFRDAETGGMSLEAPEVGPKLPVIPQNNIGLTQIPCPFAGAWTDDWGVTDTGNPIWADDSMDTSHG
ncbi:hypothetical protein BJ170DRAFT_620077 [Xylariales sp. AK1849]|nr:hypothetical protein BJ170DRAFT_620077 [Xylariales sp. AK1849]